MLGRVPIAGDPGILRAGEARLVEPVRDEIAFPAANDAIEQIVAEEAFGFYLHAPEE